MLNPNEEKNIAELIEAVGSSESQEVLKALIAKAVKDATAPISLSSDVDTEKLKHITNRLHQKNHFTIGQMVTWKEDLKNKKNLNMDNQ